MEQTHSVAHHGQRFTVARHPAVMHAVAEFTGAFEAGTLAFFDAVLPGCDRMIDMGGYVGLTALYAAGQVAAVDAFEPSPDNAALFEANLALNPALAGRIRLHGCALGRTDGQAVLYAKGAADSGSSLFQTVERERIIDGRPRGTVAVRDAATVLQALGADRRTLVKIDVEGAEYDVLPALAGVLATAKPPLHVSFHPFNIVTGDAYTDALARLRRALAVAEALACYRFLHLFEAGRWTAIGPEQRLEFLRSYLLRAKAVARIGSPQYGFVDAIGVSDEPLPALA